MTDTSTSPTARAPSEDKALTTDRKARFWAARVGRVLGIPASGQNATEKLVATLGGLLGILLVMVVSQACVGTEAAVYIVPSMGASAVLLFALPHGLLSQPWALLAGNVLSACVGVLSWKLIATPAIAAAVAVGGAIGLMHLARCVHPPGGATALAGVIGGPAIHALGFHYVLFPVAVNCLVLISVAVLFNYLFAWRRYPIRLMRFPDRRPLSPPPFSVEERHIDAAMLETNLLLDIDPGELTQLVQSAVTIAQREHGVSVVGIRVGGYYTNEGVGLQWSVRQVLDERPSPNPAHDLVIYQVVEGEGARIVRSATRTDFIAWAKSEVSPRWEQR